MKWFLEEGRFVLRILACIIVYLYVYVQYYSLTLFSVCIIALILWCLDRLDLGSYVTLSRKETKKIEEEFEELLKFTEKLRGSEKYTTPINKFYRFMDWLVDYISFIPLFYIYTWFLTGSSLLFAYALINLAIVEYLYLKHGWLWIICFKYPLHYVEWVFETDYPQPAMLEIQVLYNRQVY